MHIHNYSYTRCEGNFPYHVLGYSWVGRLASARGGTSHNPSKPQGPATPPGSPSCRNPQTRVGKKREKNTQSPAKRRPQAVTPGVACRVWHRLPDGTGSKTLDAAFFGALGTKFWALEVNGPAGRGLMWASYRIVFFVTSGRAEALGAIAEAHVFLYDSPDSCVAAFRSLTFEVFQSRLSMLSPLLGHEVPTAHSLAFRARRLEGSAVRNPMLCNFSPSKLKQSQQFGDCCLLRKLHKKYLGMRLAIVAGGLKPELSLVNPDLKHCRRGHARGENPFKPLNTVNP